MGEKSQPNHLYMTIT